MMNSDLEYTIYILLVLYLAAYAEIQLITDCIELYDWYFDDLSETISQSREPLLEIFRTIEIAFNFRELVSEPSNEPNNRVKGQERINGKSIQI